MGWTEDRVEVLKKLWLDGFSASQIAKQLGGGLTRNAVIGKVHRLGLSGRAAPSQPPRPAFKSTRAVRAVAAAPVAAPQPPSAAAAPAPASQRLQALATPVAEPPAPAAMVCEETGSATVLTLGSHQCKWPIGDPSSDGFRFCGKVSSEGPYCVQHAQVAYQAQPRKVPGKRTEASELMRSLRRYV